MSETRTQPSQFINHPVATMGIAIPQVPPSVPTHGFLSPMPPAVAKAISQVMAGVPKLERSETNTHGRYKFASIDDFLEAVRPLCAESGLIILQDEASSEMINGVDREGKQKRWLSVTYSFTLAHSSGETWAHRPTRSIIVDASMGSQAYGAAQSYTLKLFERSLFQIATGEKGQDVDEHPPVDLPQNGTRKRTRQEIGDDANRKRQQVRDVDADILQIDNLAALSRYEREVLTPEFMAGLGMKQWAVEQKVGERRRELEDWQKAAEREPYEDENDEDLSPDQKLAWDECRSWLGGATTATDLVKRATKNDGYILSLTRLTEKQREALRAYYKQRLGEFGRAEAAQ